MFSWPQTPIFDPGTPLESFKIKFRSRWSEFELQISDSGPFREDFYVFDTFPRRYFLKKSTKVRARSFLEWNSWFVSCYTARSWVLISYLHRWTSIFIYLCPEMAKMIAQICKNRRKSKGMPIHNGGGLWPPPTKEGRPPSAAGPPLWVPLWIGIPLLFLLCLHIWAIILAISGHKWT